MKTNIIRQTALIKSSPGKVYAAFTNEKKHQEFTGFKATINNKTGGRFITCSKRNFGYTLFLKPGRRIIQAWSHIHFPDNQYSIIDIKLNKTKDGFTKLTFLQTGVPAGCKDWLSHGWKSTYWKPLKDYLEHGQSKISG